MTDVRAAERRECASKGWLEIDALQAEDFQAARRDSNATEAIKAIAACQIKEPLELEYVIMMSPFLFVLLGSALTLCPPAFLKSKCHAKNGLLVSGGKYKDSGTFLVGLIVLTSTVSITRRQ